MDSSHRFRLFFASKNFIAARARFVVCLVLGVGSAALGAEFQPTEPGSLPDPVYFRQDWCPLAAQREGISAHFKLAESGCCIWRAERLNYSTDEGIRAIQPFLRYVLPSSDVSDCTGTNVEHEARRTKELSEERSRLPSKLRDIDVPSLCKATGAMIRGTAWLNEAPNLREGALPALRAELRRRSVSFNDERVRQQSIRVGDSECHLYAAWGLPASSNRTATSSRLSVQHVYGTGNYVYTENGRVTAWQD